MNAGRSNLDPELRAAIVEVASKAKGLRLLVAHGSRVKGGALPGSDLDLAMVVTSYRAARVFDAELDRRVFPIEDRTWPLADRSRFPELDLGRHYAKTIRAQLRKRDSYRRFWRQIMAQGEVLAGDPVAAFGVRLASDFAQPLSEHDATVMHAHNKLDAGRYNLKRDQDSLDERMAHVERMRTNAWPGRMEPGEYERIEVEEFVRPDLAKDLGFLVQAVSLVASGHKRPALEADVSGPWLCATLDEIPSSALAWIWEPKAQPTFAASLEAFTVLRALGERAAGFLEIHAPLASVMGQLVKDSGKPAR